MRLLWLDCETGGLEAGYHEMLTVAGIIEIDKKVVMDFHFKMKPRYPDRLNPTALKVNGLTYNEIMGFPDQFDTVYKLKKIFIKYGLRNNKLICAGHNVGFDRGFLNALFLQLGCKTLHYWLDYHHLDTMSVAAWLRYVGKLNIDSLKLVDLCLHFGIPLKAHDAFEDIQATRLLAKELQGLIK